MHEREGVYVLDRRCGGIELRDVGADTLPGRVHQQRPNPFAAVENRIAHRFVQPFRPDVAVRQRRVELVLNPSGVLFDALFETHVC